MPTSKRILCIEGNWDKGYIKQRSIRLALDYLKVNAGIDHNYQKAVTSNELYVHLKEASLKRNATLGVIYIACHGSRGTISLNHTKEEISLEDIAENCLDIFYGKVIHFGCCSTLHVSESRLRAFLEVTKAKAISGYTKDTAFHESTFLDMLYFDRYQYTDSIKILDKQMNKLYNGFIDKLGFKVIY